jgi:hypothetical protein
MSRRSACRALITNGFASIGDIGAQEGHSRKRGAVDVVNRWGGVLKCLDLTVREGSGLLFTFALR